MEELEKDVKYFTRLWQEELTRRQAAETALRNLVAAAEKMSLADSPHDVVDEVLAAVAAAKEVLK